VKERLVADWLTKAGERGGLDVAFCQILLAQRCRILRAGHSPTEAGKDIIAIAPDGELRAYQVKSGDIDLKVFDEVKPQVTNLVEAAILHPNLSRGSKHHSFLVTTGTFSEPVRLLVLGLNDAWQARGHEPLTLIDGPQLQPDLMALAADFWPVEPPDVRGFLTLYLADGKGDLDRKSFSEFLRRLLPEEVSSKPVSSRRIAAAGVFTSYLLESFHRQGDHWSAFCGWSIAAAHQAWSAEVHGLLAKSWRSSFLLTRSAALAALARLSAETLAPHALTPDGAELDDYTRLRNTVAASAVAAWHLIQLRNGKSPSSAEQATLSLGRLARGGRLWFWGESALPHFLCIAWLLEKSGQARLAEDLLLGIVGALSRRNQKLSEDPFDGPEVLPDDVLASALQMARHPEPRRQRRAVCSWTLESLLHLLARRLRRQALAAQWSEVTRVVMASFRPQRVADALLWHCENGEEATRLPGKPQSWRELLGAARTDDIAALAAILREDPDFALMFALVYPHRAGPVLVKALDTWFG
jgi:hypothetical protein